LRIVELDFSEFLAIRGQWNEAVQKSADNNIFLTWEWISTWWRHFGGHHQFVVVAVMDNGAIGAAAPLMLTRYPFPGLRLSKAGLIGSYIEGAVTDYHCFLLTRERSEHLKAIVDYLAPRVYRFEFDGIPESSKTANVLRAVQAREPMFEEEEEEECQHVSLPETWDKYLSALHKNFRGNLLRVERNLRRDYQVEFRRCEGIGDIDREMQTFFDLHQQRLSAREESGVFSDRRVREFHLDLASVLASRGWLNLTFLMLDGECAAASYGFEYAGRLYWYLSGFASQYAKYSVGSVMIMQLLRNAIDQGLSEFDFLTGDEAYKRNWNTHVSKIVTFSSIEKNKARAFARWMHSKIADSCL
jgi:CelD/BcsL family acetyltransferase involved in cellulose biosynthesis